MNFVSSYSSSKSSTVQWCLKKDLSCPEKPRYHSFFINYGGGKMSFEGNEYDKDVDGRPARCLKWHLKPERRRKHTSLLKCITSAPETCKPCLNDAA
ncbi:putative LRR receptor-like serine/threonine-protein kinase [Vitis vinifera]|uniref:Putative LRR receptor-like serine/threonine-protein kinase n=1 Tax=Vitis vinifera TaxID=29760 RepID=A0A438FH55_VITVI|nr:putative LRR receptor-like serine/threonine-protein kinase [Vitis vinifera]